MKEWTVSEASRREGNVVKRQVREAWETILNRSSKRKRERTTNICKKGPQGDQPALWSARRKSAARETPDDTRELAAHTEKGGRKQAAWAWNRPGNVTDNSQ